jgi:hypothetical protein
MPGRVPWQPVVQVAAGTETREAPRGQGATRLRQGFGEVSPKLAPDHARKRRRTSENIEHI